MNDDSRSIDQCLHGGRSTVRALLTRAGMLRKVQQCLHQHFDEPWARHLRVANIRDATLVLFVDNAASLTRVRFLEARILGVVRDELRHTVWKLEARVKPRRGPTHADAT